MEQGVVLDHMVVALDSQEDRLFDSLPEVATDRRTVVTEEAAEDEMDHQEENLAVVRQEFPDHREDATKVANHLTDPKKAEASGDCPASPPPLRSY